MTLEERIKVRYPSWTKSRVRKRIESYAKYEEELKNGIVTMCPRMNHAPDYLGVTRLSTALLNLTYATICEFAWDLCDTSGFWCVKAVAERHGLKANMERPDNADDLIHPSIFYGFMWNLFQQYALTRYSDLADLELAIPTRYQACTPTQKEMLKLNGLLPHSAHFKIFFESTEASAAIKQYEEKGYVPVPNYNRTKGEAIEKMIRKRYPGAYLQFSREHGVVVR